jgi:transcriptional regulator with XRE-family HTH domain
MDYKRQGALIAKKRREKGWTQGQLAKFAGYSSRQAINNIEKGRRRPKDVDLLAELLTINVNDLKHRSAKEAQGYFLGPTKNLARACYLCARHTNKEEERRPNPDTVIFILKRRCALGNFSINKLGTCKEFEIPF